MKQLFKQFLILTILLVSILFCFSLTKATTTGTKIYCQATLNDDFSDNIVTIILTKEETLKLKDYTLNDF